MLQPNGPSENAARIDARPQRFVEVRVHEEANGCLWCPDQSLKCSHNFCKTPALVNVGQKIPSWPLAINLLLLMAKRVADTRLGALTQRAPTFRLPGEMRLPYPGYSGSLFCVAIFWERSLLSPMER